MSIPFIDLRGQYISLKSEITERIDKVLEHGKYIMGPEIEELELALASYTGSDYCIGVSSGTDALLISLMALNIGPGDEVITTPFSFISTAEVILLVGAKPVYVDIDLRTCNINVDLIEGQITPRTRAIIPVSLYGQPADMAEINELSKKYPQISVIEDAAQSFGATYKGTKSCNLSKIGCTSFFPSKPLGCYGDGGAIFTNDEEIARACREIRIHGQESRYHHTRVGLGGRLDTIQAAVILAKLPIFESELERRFEIGAYYNQLIDESGIDRVIQKDDRSSVFGQYTIFVNDRSRVQSDLKKLEIPTAVHYPIPLNRQPAYLDFANDTPNSDLASQSVMSLPMHPNLTTADQRDIVGALIKVNQ